MCCLEYSRSIIERTQDATIANHTAVFLKEIIYLAKGIIANINFLLLRNATLGSLMG